MVGATLDPSRLNLFKNSLESFLWTYEPQRAYSIMVGTARPASLMKAFLAPPIGLDRFSLVGLDCLGVSSITVGAEAASELSVAELGSH